MNTRFVIAIAAVLAFATLPASAGVHEDMVSLDRSYIPALALTNQPKLEASKRAVERFRAQWNAFRTTWAAAPDGYPADLWASTNKEIEAALAAAEAAIASGKSLEAHDELERVREAQFRLRRAANKPYFMDDLTAFHAAMEKLAGAAAGKNPTMLSEADLAAIRAAYLDADRSWKVVLANRTQVAQQGVGGDKTPAVQSQIDVETRTLEELGAALAAGDKAKAIEKAVATKPAFSKLFQLFGDFAPVTGG